MTNIKVHSYASSKLSCLENFDLTFDGDGIITLDITGTSDNGNALKIQSDNKILLVGKTFNGVDDDFVICRFNVNGTLDTSFDGDGVVITDFNNSNDFAEDLEVLPDDRILVMGTYKIGNSSFTALARYNSNGSLDTSFGQIGKFIYKGLSSGENEQDPNSLALLSDGSFIVCLGEDNEGIYGSDDFRVTRFYPNGRVDRRTGAQSSFFDRHSTCKDVKVHNGNVIYTGRYANHRTDHVSGFATGKVRYKSDLKRSRFDYNGDGKDELAVYREGIWYLRLTPNSSDGSLRQETFGLSGDIPIPSVYLPQ